MAFKHSPGRMAYSWQMATSNILLGHNLLPEREITGVLRDAAAAHENAVGDTAEMAMHHSVASLINVIMSGISASGRP